MTTRDQESKEFRRNVTVLRSYVGGNCVYREKGLIKLVTLIDVRTEKTFLHLKLGDLKAPGFSDRDIGCFDVGCDAEYLMFEPRYVFASIVSWYLVTDDLAVQRLSDLVVQKLDPQTSIKRFHDICRGKDETIT